MIYFILGIILGILIRDIKVKTIETIEIYGKPQENKGETQFFDPVSLKEKHKNAKNIDDLLDNNI